MHILTNMKRRWGGGRIWKCCHLPWAKQCLFLNDVFALVFLVSSVIYICYHALKIHIVLQHSIFCKSRFSPTKQSHPLKWLKWKQYFLWISMFARERLRMLPLYSYFNFIYSNSFFLCSHGLQSSVVSFLPHTMKIPAFNGSHVVTDLTHQKVG